MPILVGNSGSVYATCAIIPDSIKNYTELYIVADAGAAASADIVTGTPAASKIAILRAAAGEQSPVVKFLSSTCLSVSNLSNGDVIAFIKK